MAAKKFPEHALDAVALDRFSQAPGNHQPQPGMAFGHGSQDHAEMARVKPLALGLRPQKFVAMASRTALVKRAVPLGLGSGQGRSTGG